MKINLLYAKKYFLTRNHKQLVLADVTVELSVNDRTIYTETLFEEGYFASNEHLHYYFK